MISTKCKYALRAILLVSTESISEKKITIREISEKLDLPQHFLGKILQELVPLRIISSMKGPGGGFYLTNENKKASLLEIIEAIDGPLAFTSCAIGLGQCSEKHPYPVHKEFKACHTNLREVFSSKTIGQLEHEIKELNLVLTNH
jgi:Rrf2 family protein